MKKNTFDFRFVKVLRIWSASRNIIYALGADICKLFKAADSKSVQFVLEKYYSVYMNRHVATIY